MSDVKFIYDDFSQQELASSSSQSVEAEDITRRADFYESADTVKIGNFRFRLIFHPIKRNYTVCFKKINTLGGEVQGIEDSHMSLSAHDIPVFRKVMRDMIGKY